MPYYSEVKFRKALFDYHQRLLLNLSNNPSSTIGGARARSSVQRSAERRLQAGREAGEALRQVSINLDDISIETRDPKIDQKVRCEFKNSRLAELYERFSCLHDPKPDVSKLVEDPQARCRLGAALMEELDSRYGRMPDFGWLVLGNIGKLIGISLTSVISPPVEGLVSNEDDKSQDLMQFQDVDQSNGLAAISTVSADQNNARDPNFEQTRPDKKGVRSNYNLRGHLDEVILVRWNDLYQKLATVDGKGNVLIWCKVNEKFTIQTPFYNRTKSVADFQWSNDGKTALVCYTDSFILVGSSTGQRHWHSMLNLEDYHITCASWTPNDEQLLLGVSNGNIVVIDLPHSELTELAVSYTNIRAMCWSSSNINLSDVDSDVVQSNHSASKKQSDPRRRGPTTIVNQRRLSRDCSVFSRYRFCSQGPMSSSGHTSRRSAQVVGGDQTRQEVGASKLISFKGEQGTDILAVDLANNTIQLFSGDLDDPKPKTISVNLESYIMQWSHDGKILAVAGFNIQTAAPSVGCIRCRYLNSLKFYDRQGQMIHERNLKYTRYPITAFTWAHNSSRIFFATGPRLHSAKVFLGVPKLSLIAMSCTQRHTKLSRKPDIWASLENGLYSINTLSWQSKNCPINLLKIFKQADRSEASRSASSSSSFASGTRLTSYSSTTDSSNCEFFSNMDMPVFHYNSNVYLHKLPRRLRIDIDRLCSTTIKPPFEDCWTPGDVIWHVPKVDQRYYCTLVCYSSDRKLGQSAGYHYRNDWSDKLNDNHSTDQYKIFVLYVEFQGFYIPILRARRVGLMKPEFVIFDPDVNDSTSIKRQHKVSDVSPHSSFNGHVPRGHMTDRPGYQYHETPLWTPSNYSPPSFGDGHIDNCAELHYHNPEGSSPQQSCSDADQYYNFDTGSRISDHRVDNTTRQGRYNFLAEYEIFNRELTGHHDLDDNIDFSSPEKQFGRDFTFRHIPTDYQSPSKRFAGGFRVPRHRLTKNPDNSFHLSEKHELVRIKSNIWGTKFKLINEPNSMIKNRSVLATVVYRASILHLQPRQIFLKLRDMSNYCCLCSKHHHKLSLEAQSLKTNKIEAVICNNQNLIDDSKTIDTPKKAQRSKSRSGIKEKNGNEKVVLIVGDNIRVAPKLEANQEYRMSGTSELQKENKSGLRRGRSDLNYRSQDGMADRKRTRNTPGSSKRIPGRSSSLKRDSHRTTLDKDDFITVSIGQGDQVRVELSAHRSLDRMNSDILATKEHRANLKAREDEALATDKTLKSIQTITQMIVAMSEKAKRDNSDGERATPSGLDIRCEPSCSSQFIPPDPPIHRPRRSRADERTAIVRARILNQTQSARSTPVRQSRNRGQSSGSIRSIRNERNDSLTRKLPEPPPQVSLSRRLSSSAKRLLNGSLRSLYGLGGYSAASDIEPDESEPLVQTMSGASSPSIVNRLQLTKETFKQATNDTSQPIRPERGRSRLRRKKSDALDMPAASSNQIPRSTRLVDAKSESVACRRSLSEVGRTTKRKRVDNPKFLGPASFRAQYDDEDDLHPIRPLCMISKRGISDSESFDDLADFDLATSSNLRGRNWKFGPRRYNSLAELSGSRAQLYEIEARRLADIIGERSRKKSICNQAGCCCVRELSLRNRPPLWNELSQVYQLDFGGRVTQESAKNLQIEFEGNLVST